jgi:hypothetical protein
MTAKSKMTAKSSKTAAQLEELKAKDAERKRKVSFAAPRRAAGPPRAPVHARSLAARLTAARLLAAPLPPSLRSPRRALTTRFLISRASAVARRQDGREGRGQRGRRRRQEGRQEGVGQGLEARGAQVLGAPRGALGRRWAGSGAAARAVRWVAARALPQFTDRHF